MDLTHYPLPGHRLAIWWLGHRTVHCYRLILHTLPHLPGWVACEPTLIGWTADICHGSTGLVTLGHTISCSADHLTTAFSVSAPPLWGGLTYGTTGILLHHYLHAFCDTVASWLPVRYPTFTFVPQRCSEQVAVVARCRVITPVGLNIAQAVATGTAFLALPRFLLVGFAHKPSTHCCHVKAVPSLHADGCVYTYYTTPTCFTGYLPYCLRNYYLLPLLPLKRWMPFAVYYRYSKFLRSLGLADFRRFLADPLCRTTRPAENTRTCAGRCQAADSTERLPHLATWFGTSIPHGTPAAFR